VLLRLLFLVLKRMKFSLTSSASSNIFSTSSAISLDQVPISKLLIFFNFDSSSANLSSNLLLRDPNSSESSFFSQILSTLSVLSGVADDDFSRINSELVLLGTFFAGTFVTVSSSGTVLRNGNNFYQRFISAPHIITRGSADFFPREGKNFQGGGPGARHCPLLPSSADAFGAIVIKSVN